MTRQQFPEPTVGALIFNTKGEILLMKSHKWRNKYVLPGGHVELGETLERAITREVKEETRLQIHDLEFICFQEFIFDKAFWKKRHFLFFDFACKTNTQKAVLNSEGQEYIWVSVKEALKLPLEPYLRNTINNYLKTKSDGT